MPRKKTKSESHYGLWHIVKIPICHITLHPQFEKGSKTKILDEEGNVIYDAEKQVTISGIWVYEDRLNDAIKFLHENGLHEADIIRPTTELPLKCPICDQEGDPTFSFDNRPRNKKWVDKNKPIRIYYHHGYGLNKHYYGKWEEGSIRFGPKITDIRKATPRGYLFSNKT